MRELDDEDEVEFEEVDWDSDAASWAGRVVEEGDGATAEWAAGELSWAVNRCRAGLDSDLPIPNADVDDDEVELMAAQRRRARFEG